MSNPLATAIDKIGGQTKTAKALTALLKRNPEENPIRQSHVRTWLKRSKRGVPTEFCPALEKLSGIPRELLRPDIDWGRGRKPRSRVTP